MSINSLFKKVLTSDLNVSEHAYANELIETHARQLALLHNGNDEKSSNPTFRINTLTDAINYRDKDLIWIMAGSLNKGILSKRNITYSIALIADIEDKELISQLCRTTTPSISNNTLSNSFIYNSINGGLSSLASKIRIKNESLKLSTMMSYYHHFCNLEQLEIEEARPDGSLPLTGSIIGTLCRLKAFNKNPNDFGLSFSFNALYEKSEEGMAILAFTNHPLRNDKEAIKSEILSFVGYEANQYSLADFVLSINNIAKGILYEQSCVMRMIGYSGEKIDSLLDPQISAIAELMSNDPEIVKTLKRQLLVNMNGSFRNELIRINAGIDELTGQVGQGDSRLAPYSCVLSGPVVAYENISLLSDVFDDVSLQLNIEDVIKGHMRNSFVLKEMSTSSPANVARIDKAITNGEFTPEMAVQVIDQIDIESLSAESVIQLTKLVIESAAGNPKMISLYSPIYHKPDGFDEALAAYMIENNMINIGNMQFCNMSGNSLHLFGKHVSNRVKAYFLETELGM